MPVKNKSQNHPEETVSQEGDEPSTCWIRPGERLRAGMTCPRCQQGKLDYNGLLQLACPVCGLIETGACT
jgi:uncharacterized protein (DUF983 family)